MSSTRTIYVAKQNNEIARIDSAGTVTLTFAKLPANSDPRAIVTDFGGFSYTANFGTNTISQVSPTGTVVEYAALGAGAGPTGLTRDHQGRLWVANALGDSVVVFDTSKPAGTAPVATYALPRGASPRVLSVDEFDDVFVADAGTNAISVIVPGKPAPLTVYSGTRSAPTALALTSDNKLLFALKDSDRVSSIDLETKIGTSTIGPLTVGSAFTGAATATGVGDIAFSSPDLPAWLKLDPATGAFSGTPTTPGPFSFTLRAQSSIGRGHARTVSVDVAEAPFTPTPTATPGTTTTGGSGAGGQGSGAGTGSGGHGTSALASTGAGDATP